MYEIPAASKLASILTTTAPSAFIYPPPTSPTHHHNNDPKPPPHLLRARKHLRPREIRLHKRRRRVHHPQPAQGRTNTRFIQTRERLVGRPQHPGQARLVPKQLLRTVRDAEGARGSHFSKVIRPFCRGACFAFFRGSFSFFWHGVGEWGVASGSLGGYALATWRNEGTVTIGVSGLFVFGKRCDGMDCTTPVYVGFFARSWRRQTSERLDKLRFSPTTDRLSP